MEDPTLSERAWLSSWWRCAAAGMVAAAIGSAAFCAETVELWLGTETVEVSVLQLAAFPPLNPAQAQAQLAGNGLGAFDFSGYDGWGAGCRLALLFSHPNASAAPILAASTTMAGVETPYFWTFAVGPPWHGHIPNWYRLAGQDLPPRPELEVILADLGIVGTLIGTDFEYTLHSEARSGLEILAEVDLLHQAIGPGLYTEYGAYGCPSGGGGDSGGPLDPLEVPSLSAAGSILFAALLGCFGLLTSSRPR